MKNPCLACGHHLAGGDKNDSCCAECQDRVAYHAALGDMTHSLPDRLCDYHRSGGPSIIEPPEKESVMVENSQPPPPRPATKICSRKACRHGGKPQPLENFDNRSNSKDGKAPYCKDCMREYHRKKKPRRKATPSAKDCDAKPLTRLAGLLAADVYSHDHLAEIKALCETVADQIDTYLRLRTMLEGEKS